MPEALQERPSERILAGMSETTISQKYSGGNLSRIFERIPRERFIK